MEQITSTIVSLQFIIDYKALFSRLASYQWRRVFRAWKRLEMVEKDQRAIPAMKSEATRNKALKAS